ncbi:glycerol-3-phosphate dehydrogenase/oxidase [Hymenobacter latericus]|uniref:glycerol-3-phosphate dehydrogenase/oxidase n=1 Tax=Hymenobacter sp. YIM 151858-1 TaxID=2987688 RepID=UPI002226559F|nr:glycerol-3-phosphate dehydrogenase/oxidase [Hymenobacter sp. YIM 151858-1]UYZ60388.1 glycerol-3-phosphate dehydrogenase/oxidase [Hymenobacter sp. YIM 151858-1]
MPTAAAFSREAQLRQLAATTRWDVVVVGGGATGLGVALDAVSRGFSVLVLEQVDFAKGTSSRSTKLVHGGVRYLAQGDLGLVREALRERGLLLRNAPHLVHNQTFVIPAYNRLSRPYYALGLKLYDVLAGRLGLGSSQMLTAAQALGYLGSNLRAEGLRGGVLYHDGQFDDARLALNLAQTCAERGATVLNYAPVTALLKNDLGQVIGVELVDAETGARHQALGHVVVNATGVFVDEVLRLDEPSQVPLVRPSQGVHLVLPRRFLPGSAALLIPRTDDGRVLFAVPWYGRVVLGTTDTPLPQASPEPRALEQEVNFILNTAARYLQEAPTRADVLSVFAGLRPLAATSKGNNATKNISRRHYIRVSASGLLTITGGKWTTFRQMGEDVLDQAVALGKLPDRPSRSAELPIHGAQSAPYHSQEPGHLGVYGSDLPALRRLIAENPAWAKPLDATFEYVQGEVVWAARHEMARTVEDVLARRLRVLFLDARAAQRMAPQVAELLAQELGRSAEWQREQVRSFTALAQGYLLT